MTIWKRCDNVKGSLIITLQGIIIWILGSSQLYSKSQITIILSGSYIYTFGSLSPFLFHLFGHKSSKNPLYIPAKHFRVDRQIKRLPGEHEALSSLRAWHFLQDFLAPNGPKKISYCRFKSTNLVTSQHWDLHRWHGLKAYQLTPPTSMLQAAHRLWGTLLFLRPV